MVRDHILFWFGRLAFHRRTLAVLLLVQAGSVQAHDIYSSWAETKLLPDKLHLTLTLARSSAHDLLPSAETRPPITPQTFPDVAPDLRTVASELLRISDGDTVLPLRSVEVNISGDNDITFNLTYARPKVGPITFYLHYLRFLVDGHVATLVVSHANGDDLGWSPLTVDQPAFHVALPHASAPKGKER